MINEDGAVEILANERGDRPIINRRQFALFMPGNEQVHGFFRSGVQSRAPTKIIVVTSPRSTINSASALSPKSRQIAALQHALRRLAARGANHGAAKLLAGKDAVRPEALGQRPKRR
jgi:hypothetical protein